MKKSIRLLNILHILNDGFSASFLLLLPFIAKDIHLSLTQVGILGAITSISEMILAIPSSHITTKFGDSRVLMYT